MNNHKKNLFIHFIFIAFMSFYLRKPLAQWLYLEKNQTE